MPRPLPSASPEVRYPPATYAVDRPLREKLNRRAQELDRSASYVVRAALAAYLARPADPAAKRKLELLKGAPARRKGGAL
jgi:hypothetical protein